VIASAWYNEQERFTKHQNNAVIMPHSAKRHTSTVPAHFPIREDKQWHIEVHVAGVCIRQGSDGVSLEILIAKRTSDRELFPGKWECGGGQVWPGESFKEAIQRQMYEEFNLSVDVLSIIGTYQIPRVRPQKTKIPGLTFLCRVNGSGEEATLNKREHSEYRWIAPSDVKNYKFIGGVAKDIYRAIQMLPPTRPKDDHPKRIGFVQHD
jgi:8-oxo-dGTP pyrophosphatase MutT (NUDIX family)